MKLKQWTEAERGRAAALAAYLKVPSSFMSKMVSGEKSIPVEHMADIEVFTGGAVTRQEMCPDRWSRIWPELGRTTGALSFNPDTKPAGREGV